MSALKGRETEAEADGGHWGCAGLQRRRDAQQFSGCQGPYRMIRVWGQFQESMFHGHVIRSCFSRGCGSPGSPDMQPTEEDPMKALSIPVSFEG